jgi:hypothetical protein
MAGSPPWIRDDKHLAEICEALPLMFKDGESVAEICVEFGIARSTFYKNLEDYPELAEAYSMGKVYCEAWWQKLGRFGAAGKINIQPTVFIANMNNRFGWSQKVDHKSTDGSMTPKGVDITANMTAEQAAEIYKDMINGRD